MTENQWETLIIDPILGYNTSVPPNKLKPGESPKIENMAFSSTRLETDRGYEKKGQVVRGNPRLIYQYEKKSGVTEILLVTNSTVYKWNSGEWQYLASGVATLVDGLEAAGQTTITVDDITGFSDGDFVGITLDDGTQHQTTVNGTPAGSDIVITDAIPTGRNAPDNTAFVKAVVLTGADDSPVSAATMPAYDVVIITNGYNNVQAYNGTECIDCPNLVTAVGGGNCYAKGVVHKDNKIIIFNTNENGEDYPQRVRWSATATYQDWSTVGDAGHEDLWGDEDPIVGIVPLAAYGIVYRSRSIDIMEYVGSQDFIYYFQNRTREEGAASLHSVVSKYVSHMFVGGHGFYSYDGSYNLTLVGAEIWDTVFGITGNISDLYKQNTTSFYSRRDDRAYFLIPSDENTNPSRVWIYDFRHNAWTTRIFNDDIYSAAEVEFISGVTWQEAVGAWEDAEWMIAWNDIVLLSGTPEILMCGVDSNGNGRVYKYDLSALGDDNVAITGEYRTLEMHTPPNKIRINRLRVNTRRTNIEDIENDWSVLDLNQRASIDKSVITVTDLVEGETFEIFKQFSRGELDEDFEITIKINISALGASQSIKPIHITGAEDSTDEIALVFWSTTGTAFGLQYTVDQGGANVIAGVLEDYDFDTDYYIRIYRDESYGDYGNVYLDIYTDEKLTTNILSTGAAADAQKSDFTRLSVTNVSGSDGTASFVVSRVQIGNPGSALPVTVEYSVDRGRTWVNYGYIAPGFDYDIKTIWKQIVDDHIMFRFLGTKYGLDRILIEWKPETVY